MKNRLLIVIGALVSSWISTGQDIGLFQQFNGRYDYTAIGNTLNQFENNLDDSFCEILPSSSADLNLLPSQNLIAAYLYWAGSGVADTEVLLNDLPINSEINYSVSFNSGTSELVYFACFSNVTELIQNLGNGSYTLSELDIAATLTNNPGYCDNRTNFAGWSLYLIYEDQNLPLNQLSLFQGLEIINVNVNEKTILLDNINVLDNQGAKIGFLAWEGDDALNFGETLSINDNILSNPPLNLSDNAFNGTNTFTNSTEFYNADLDVYDIQDNIAIGDTSATIKLTTGDFDSNGVFRADLIILNNIITVLNSQLPDATVTIDEFIVECNSRVIDLEYTIYNTNSTDPLPPGTPIAFYANGVLLGQMQTQDVIPIDSSENGAITLFVPDGLDTPVLIEVVVDDDGSGMGVVNETDESNNSYQLEIQLPESALNIELSHLLSCDLGFNSALFDLTEQLQLIDPSFDIDTAQFYTSEADADLMNAPILIPESYSNTQESQLIYIRIEHMPCYQLFEFELQVENCPPFVPQGFSPNDDGYNDWFNIQGLYDIFDTHELLIFNRYGTLIFEGNNDSKWRGRSNRGLNAEGKLVPVGTYFYVLHLNDPNYRPLTGWVYVNY